MSSPRIVRFYLLVLAIAAAVVCVIAANWPSPSSANRAAETSSTLGTTAPAVTPTVPPGTGAGGAATTAAAPKLSTSPRAIAAGSPIPAATPATPAMRAGDASGSVTYLPAN